MIFSLLILTHNDSIHAMIFYILALYHGHKNKTVKLPWNLGSKAVKEA